MIIRVNAICKRRTREVGSAQRTIYSLSRLESYSMTLEDFLKVAEMVLKYLTALAWPAVVLTLAFGFRKHLADIVSRLKNADLPGGVKINLQETIKEAEKLSVDISEVEIPKNKRGTPAIPVTEANARMIANDLRPSPSGLDLNYYRDLAQQDPNIALAGLRIELELMTNNLAKGFKVEITPRSTIGRLARDLHRNNAITSDQRELIGKVSSVCNAAAHGQPLTFDEAIQTIDSAEVLAEQYISWLSWGFN